MIGDINTILQNGKQYFVSLQDDKNARYKSWEHCYTVFGAYRGKEVNDSSLEILCLHLAFYLASWGMYRGSSFLLQKDYLIHAPAVRTLIQPRYAHLWAVPCEYYLQDTKYLSCLLVLSDQLREIYKEIRTSVKAITGKPDTMMTISDTLITKILLGTLGCVPAYDQFFIRGIKEYNVASMIFNANSIRRLSNFYLRNKNVLEAWRIMISGNGLNYPQMKILDMCFWQAGYNLK
jgi:hypothetical protein